MIKNKLINPLCESYSIRKVETYDVNKIIYQYAVIGVDVFRFFENIDSVTLFECLNTGYRFYYPFSTIGDANFYKDLSLNRKNYYSIRWEHSKIITRLNRSEKILEIGSGFGAFLNLLKSKSIEAEGIELNPEAIKNCKNQNLKMHNELIEDFAPKHIEEYDVVCYFQVLEHIKNINDFIKNSLLTLKKNGKLIIGVPNNNPYLFVNDKYHALNLPPHHAGLWDKKSLKGLEQVFNIKLTSLEYEPLEKTYNQFLKTYMNNSNLLYSLVLKITNKLSPDTLKKILCKFIKGRNILVVYKKLAE